KAMPGDGDAIVGWVGTLADVTAEAEAEAAMSDARDKATEASRLKSDFLANMSHEIRTPMNGVIGMTELLLETQLDDVQRDYAQTVRSSGQALMTIINDILDFSRIEAGKLEVENAEFSVRAIVDDLVDLLAGPARAKGIELVAFVETAVPSVVGGDAGRVRQVLTNLIGNAIKFTPSGEVVVRVAGAAVGSDDTSIRFEVSDTGIGIADGKLAEIFHPFVQADSSTSRQYGGTGLGLAISGRLVALMGGECGVSSHLGEGSCFWFTIRVHEVDDHVACADAVVEEPTWPIGIPERAAGHLLLAEDNLINQKVAVAMLSGAGYRVDTVLNGAEALQAAAAHPYDAILMDCHMPELSGYEATAAIRAWEGHSRHTPIIAMTAGARDEDRAHCLAEGMDSYLAKPVSKDALLALVARSLKSRPATEITLDPDVIEKLRGFGEPDEDDFVGQLVDQFIRDTDPLVVRLRDAFENGDAASVGEIAHSIKGGCAQLGGWRLASSSGRLEDRAFGGSLRDGQADLREVEVHFHELRRALLHHMEPTP
ncbi:MAG: two-component system, sensor histidine kinase and response regulator, partial [Nocardioidaceae bacterium]|nr:two-component system, sensor histidine kinase and response regulator [Nocardioidaceae bacterium]